MRRARKRRPPAPKGAATIYSKGYVRNGKGQILSTSSNRPGQRWAYSYDRLDRLVGADNLGDNTLDRTFAFDAATRFTSNSGVGSYTCWAAGSGIPVHAPKTASAVKT